MRRPSVGVVLLLVAVVLWPGAPVAVLLLVVSGVVLPSGVAVGLCCGGMLLAVALAAVGVWWEYVRE